MDSIDKIIENPGAFVGHLVDAVKLGFKQFGQNFWAHLKDGLVQWLFGTFADAGIHMPASFDIAGIFDLVCQVLGLTWPRLRGKIVKIIGEKNTERLEFVAKYVQTLVTGGFAGLWQQVQQDMSGLWDMVVNGVKDWIVRVMAMFKGKDDKKDGKDGKDDKHDDGPLEPAVVVDEIAQALTKKPQARKPADAIAETKQLAESLKQQYQPRLKTGTITITIDESPADVGKSHDIEFSVSINPKKSGRREVEEETPTPDELLASAVKELERTVDARNGEAATSGAGDRCGTGAQCGWLRRCGLPLGVARGPA